MQSISGRRIYIESDFLLLYLRSIYEPLMCDLVYVQVVNKWLGLQAMSDVPGNVENVRGLLDHPAFDIRNPNKVCSCFFPAMNSPFLYKSDFPIWLTYN